MAQKKSNSRQKTDKNQKKTALKTNRLVQLLLGLAFIGVSVYLFWLINQKVEITVEESTAALGVVGAFIYRSLASLAGNGKMLIPLGFLVFGINFILPKFKLTGFQGFGIVFSCMMILSIIHLPLAFGLNSISLAWLGEGGGIIGALIAWVLAKAFGEIGSYIVAYILLILGIVLSSKGQIFRWLRAWGKKFIAFVKGVISGTSKIILEEVEEKQSEPQKATQKTLPPKQMAKDAPKPFIINNLQEIQQDISDNKENKKEKKLALTDNKSAKNILHDEDVQNSPVKAQNNDETKKENADKKEIKNEKKDSSGGQEETFVPQKEEIKEYKFPSLELLDNKKSTKGGVTQKEINEKAALLDKTLADFGVKGHISEVSVGPAITRYEFQPASGVKVSKIVNLSDDIALNLAASGIRIEAPIPGKAAVGIEVANKETSTVSLREIIDTPTFKEAKSKLTVALGKDIAGQPVITDLGKMPHLLIAGATGSGKSVCMNTLIVSILYKAKPDEVKFLMVDPKMVELGNYNGIPHLIAPVVTDAKKAASSLRWAVMEMERRYELFANTGNKDIERYNNYAEEKINQAKTEEEKQQIEILPYIIILIDELADLMMVAPADVEDAICRLAQMARAAGMHLVVATQRPSVDVITGIIKANIPSRIAFSVSSQVDSRTILDMGGAEKLLGRGDMLFFPSGLPKPKRVQGVYVSDKEIDRVVEAIKQQGQPKYDENIGNMPILSENNNKMEEEEDELIGEACKLFIENGQASISALQRRFRIGYNRAARIIDQMEQKGMIGPYEGSKPRQVKITLDEYYQQYGS